MSIPNNARLTTISPQLASLMLKSNTRNRPIRLDAVKRYAGQMKAGEWKLTGETIKVGSDNSLLDGQHRLLACIEAGEPFEAYIVSGLSPDVFDVIDVGIPRRASDALHIMGETSVALLAAALGWLYRFEQGTLHYNAASKMSSHEAIELLKRHPEFREFVTMANGTHQLVRVGRTSISAACYYIFSRQNRLLADEFFKRLATGTDLKGDEPVYHLREKLLQEQDKHSKVRANYVIALFFRAWIHTKEGRRIKLLSWWNPETQKFPDIGPIEPGAPA